MASYEGLMLKLKDKGTPVNSKLKLAKFAWAKEDVVIPNKHQQILDFLCGLLVNRKKHSLSPEDIDQICETLSLFLCRTTSGLEVKPSILQALTEILSLLSKSWTSSQKRKKDRKSLLIVVKCVQHLLIIPSMTRFQLEPLCSLLSVVCHFVLTSDPSLTADLWLLLERCAAAVLKCQKVHLHQIQVLHSVLDKVSGQAMRALELKGCKALQDLLISTFLHPDHKEAYIHLLNHVYQEPGHAQLKQPPKGFNQVFSILEDQTNSYTVGTFIPAFMKKFVELQSLQPRPVFLLLKHLVKAMGVDVEAGTTLSQVECELWLASVSQCVEACRSCDLFSSNNEDNDVLKWFCRCTELILKQERLPSWYIYLGALLSLQPLVVEKYLTGILKAGFMESEQIPETSLVARDSFFQELVSTSMKLRRTSELVSSLLAASEDAELLPDVFTHLPLTHSRLETMFSDLPSNTLLEIWEKIQAFSEKMVVLAQSNQDVPSPRLQWILSLYEVLLRNARLFEHRAVGVLRLRRAEVCCKLERNVLLPLVKLGVDIPQVKGLLTAWSVVHVLSGPQWCEAVSMAHEEEDKGKLVDKLMKHLDPGPRLRLRLQRSEIAQADSQDSVAKVQSQGRKIERLANSLLEFPGLTDREVLTPWPSKCRTQEAVHQFRKFSHLFPLVGTILPASVVDRCAEIIVEVVSLGSTDTQDSIPEDHTTLVSEVMTFLGHPSTREVGQLQQCIATHAWRQLLKDWDAGSLKSPKKKKTKRKTQSAPGGEFQEVFDFITALEETRPSVMLDLTSLEMSKSFSLSDDHLIQLLGNLDLEFLPGVSLRCQLGLLVLASTLIGHSCDVGASAGKFVTDMKRLLIRCLSMSNLSALFECIGPGEFLSFICKVCSQVDSEDGQLLEASVQAVMNDHKCVLAMPAYAKQVVSELRQGGNVVKMSMVAAMLNSCHKYLAKPFHVEEVSSAARQVFFCLAKFVIKHGLEWMERTKTSGKKWPQLKPEHSLSPEGVGKKRKRKVVEDEGEKASEEVFKGEKMTEVFAWKVLVQSTTEVLHLWSEDVADERVQRELQGMVDVVVDKCLDNLKSKSSVKKQTEETELNFISACCHCLRRWLKSPSAADTRLLTQERIETIWHTCYSLALSSFSDRLSTWQASETSQQLRSGSAPRPSSVVDGGEDEEKNEIEDMNVDQGRGEGDTGTDSLARSRMSQTEAEAGAGLEVLGSCAARSWVGNFDLWPSDWKAWVNVLTAALESVWPQAFQSLLQHMLNSMERCSENDVHIVLLVCCVWRGLVVSDTLAESLGQEFFKSMYQFLAVSLSVLQALDKKKTSDTSSLTQSPSGSESLTTGQQEVPRFIVLCVSDFLDLGKTLITPRMVLLCLHAGMALTVTSVVDLEALHRLTNTLLVHHTNTALTSVPTVISLVNKLMSSCVTLGGQDRLAVHTDQVEDVVHSAQLVTRMLLLLSSSTYKTDLNKIAHSVLAEYVTCAQTATIHTAVKRELSKGLYKLLSICDKYRLASLHASLPTGVRETFKFLHQEYDKYHRYKGTV